MLPFFTTKEQFNQTIHSLNNTTPPSTFELTNDAHLNKVIEYINAVNTHLPVLKHRDQRIATGFAIAGAALAFSAIIPFSLTIAMSGVAYGAYYLGGRDEPYNKFNAALEGLAHCCDWALSDLTDQNKLKNEHIKQMLKTLASHATQEDLVTIMGSEAEAECIIKALAALTEQEASNAMNTKKTVSPYKLATKDDFNYHLYGYKQGGTLASLATVVKLSFQKAFAYICELVSGASNNAPTPTTAAPSM